MFNIQLWAKLHPTQQLSIHVHQERVQVLIERANGYLPGHIQFEAETVPGALLGALDLALAYKWTDRANVAELGWEPGPDGTGLVPVCGPRLVLVSKGGVVL